jgi:nicotinamidase-related amidase
MSSKTMENTKNTALLVMDIQTGILGVMPDVTELLSNTRKVISNAREKSIPVIYVVVGFRKGMPEVNMNNKGFAAAKSAGWMDTDAFMTIHPEIAPLKGEVTVVKRRVSAFTGSDLEVILRAYNTDHIVLTGISTSGVVLTTLREAADKDYRITVIADCCADLDEEVHRVLTTKVFQQQADVITSAEWLA